jgi:hypothetical protein
MSTSQLRRRVKKLAEQLPDAALKDAVRSLTFLKRAIPSKELTRAQKERRLRRAIAVSKKEERQGKLIAWDQVRSRY